METQAQPCSLCGPSVSVFPLTLSWPLQCDSVWPEAVPLPSDFFFPIQALKGKPQRGTATLPWDPLSKGPAIQTMFHNTMYKMQGPSRAMGI